MTEVKIYDTTLRDGAQAEGVSFSSADKLRIAQRLDQLGFSYIEGGWPGSNPKDMEFFRNVKELKLSGVKITAFGSTRRAGCRVEDDANLRKMLEAGTEVVTIFGKSWILHVRDILRTTMEENLKMISESVAYMKSQSRKVIYDAEHFFDGFKEDREYALETLRAALEAGAECLVLCDTNGGTLPLELGEIMKDVREAIEGTIGIHAHNDSGVAVANTLIAVAFGATHVQGTINGYGERSGNANLCTIIPNLKIKMGIDCISDARLGELTEVSRFVDELANMRHYAKAPYVGVSAFAHKGGVHVNAVEKNPRGYEHIEPSLVGNRRRILISELSGRSNILYKAAQLDLDLDKDTPETREILKTLKDLEHEGYEFEAAEASFELLMKKSMKLHRRFFELEGFRVIVEKREDNRLISEATVKVTVDGKKAHTVAEGDGPIHALDRALRRALQPFYPAIAAVRLADFKVRVLDPQAGTAAKVRVLLESRDDEHIWGTVGVSENIIEASWHALVDSVEYKLLREEEKKGRGK